MLTPKVSVSTKTLNLDDGASIGACMKAAGKEVMMDVQNYTNKQPVSFVSLVHNLA